MRYPPTANFRDSPLFWLLLSAFSLGLHGAIAVLIFQRVIRIETISAADWVEVELLPLPTESAQPTVNSPTPASATPIPTSTPQAPAIAQPIPPSTPNPNPRPTPSPKSPTPTPNPKPPTPTPTPPTPTPTPTPKSPTPSPNPTPTPPSPTPSPNPTPTPKSPTPTPNPPAPTPSPQPPTPTPTPPTPTPSPTPPSPTPSPNPTPTPAAPTPTPPSPTPSPVSPSSLSVQLGTLALTNPDVDVPDAGREAKPVQNQQRLENISYLIPPSVKLTERLVLDLSLVIDNQGKVDEVLTATSSQNSLTETQAKQLSSKILESWQFEPTYMGGQPVFQSYYLRLTIEPNF